MSFPSELSNKVRSGADAVRNGTCQRCGFVAEHHTAIDCIDALRDRIADL